MASEGPNSGATFADDSGVGTVTWTDPGNAAASDDSRAVCSMGTSAVGHYLKATNFGFAIPAGATIDGIVVEIEKSWTNGQGGVLDNRVRIVKGGAIGSTDRSDVNAWNSTDGYTTYGTSSDLWGETWTATDINASDFGVALSPLNNSGTKPAVGEIDHIRITVHYTEASGNPWYAYAQQ